MLLVLAERRCIIAATLVFMLAGTIPTHATASTIISTLSPEVEDSTYYEIPANDEIVYETTDLFHRDPQSHWSCGYWLYDNIYETLYTYPWDNSSSVPSQPLLATGLEISDDGLNYTFTLREGVRFHDGTPFNATCVQMNFWRILGHGWDGGFGPAWMVAEPILGGQAVEDAVMEYGDGSPQHLSNWTDWVENSGAVEVLETYKVRIRLAYPFTPFLAAVSFTASSMISPTFFMAHGGMAPGGEDYYMDTHACGTGPYKVVEYVNYPDTGYMSIKLTLNQDYWRATDTTFLPRFPQSGKIVNVTLVRSESLIMGSDLPDSIVARISEGTSDGAYNTYDLGTSALWNGQPPPETDRNWDWSNDGNMQSNDPTVKIWEGYPEYDVAFLGFNLHPYLNFSGEATLSPWTNKNLRYAISYAFDYQLAIENMTYGRGLQAQGPIPRGMFGHDDNLFMFEHDLDRAVEYWNLAMAEGIDDVWRNNSFSLDLYYNEGSTNRVILCNLIKDGLESILAHPSSMKTSWGGDADHSQGTLDTTVKAVDWTTYLNAVVNETLPIYFLGWYPSYSDPHDFVSAFVDTTVSTYPKRVGLDQDPTWNAAEVDAWVLQASSELDPTTRRELYYDIQEAIVDHAAYIWCYQTTSFHVEGSKMHGYAFHPMRGPYFYHYYKDYTMSNGDLDLIVHIALYSVILSLFVLVYWKTRPQKISE